MEATAAASKQPEVVRCEGEVQAFEVVARRFANEGFRGIEPQSIPPHLMPEVLA